MFESSKFLTHSHFALNASRATSGRLSKQNAVMARCAQVLYTGQYYSGVPPYDLNGNLHANVFWMRFGSDSTPFVAVKTSEDADTARLYALRETGTTRYIHSLEFFDFA